MNSSEFPFHQVPETYWRGIILALSGAVIIFTVWCLSNGITTIFMHLYYFPIVLLAYHYRWKGCGLATLLALAYLSLVVVFNPGQADVILGAFYRFLVFVGIAAVIASISERLVQVQDNLGKTRRFGESVITNAYVWISVLAPDGTLLVWNHAAEVISGYKKADVVGKNTVWKQLYPDNAYRKKVTVEIERIIGRDTLLDNFETEIRCADGSVKTIVWNTRSMRDSGEKVTGYIAIGRDITKQIRAEAEIRHLASFPRLTPVNIVETDLGGRILFINPAMENTLAVLGISDPGLFIPADFLEKAASESPGTRPAQQERELVIHGSTFTLNLAFVPESRSVRVYATDITARKKTEKKLRESEEKFREIFNNINDAVHLHEVEPDGKPGRFLDVNDAACRMLLVFREELLARNPLDYATGYHNPPLDEVIRQLRARGAATFETGHRRADGTIVPVEINAHVIKLMGKTVVLSVIRDLTYRKKTEEEIRFSNVILSTQQETSPDGILIVDESGKILSFNMRFVAIWGIPDDLIASHEDEHVLQFVAGQCADPESFLSRVRYLYEHREEKSHEEIRLKDKRVLERYSAPMLGEDKRYFGRVWYFHDVTERKRAEEALRESEKKYRTLFENMLEGFAYCRMIYDDKGSPVDWVYLDVNKEFGKLTGLNNIIGKQVLAAIPDIREQTPTLFDTYGRVSSTGQPETFEIYFQPLKMWMKISVFSPEKGYFVAVFDNMTERKLAEAALRESEEKYHQLYDSMMDAYSTVEMGGRIILFNESFQKMVGYEKEEIYDLTYNDLTPDKWHTIEEEIIKNQVLPRGYSEIYEKEYRSKDGTVFPVELRTFLVRDNAGNPQSMSAIIRDITKRKRAEEALKESEERFRGITERISDLIFLVDPDGYPTFMSPSVTSILGFPPESYSGKKASWEITHKEDIVKLGRAMESLKNGSPAERVEFRMLKRDGSYAVFDGTGTPVFIHGIYSGVQVVARDITERKRAEEALRESRQLFMDIISFLPDPTFVIDRDGKVLAWNRALEQISGISAGDIVGKGDYEYSLWLYGKRCPILIDLVLHPDQDAGGLSYTNIHTEGRTVTAQTEITRPGGGHKITLSLVASPLIDSQGKITGAIESIRDISRLREAEAELVRINQNLEKIVRERTRALEEEVVQRLRAEKDVQAALDYTRSVIEANPDLMVVLDGTGAVLDVNLAAELLAGIPRDQLIGTRYFRYLVDDGTHIDDFSRLLEHGRIEKIIQIPRKDGRITPLAVNATVIAGGTGTVMRIIVSGHDITRQKQDEEAIRASLNEKVILLREVHHRVKNNLQIIISLTNLQMRQTSDPEVKQIISETQNRVRAMSLVHEKLYRSENLSQIDFADYSRFLATHLFSFYRTDTQRVRLEMTMGPIMVDINTGVPLGLLMNELISNALKHAFPHGMEGTISISGGEDGDRITLVVRDDGIGIPEETDWRNTTSLGMRLISILIDQLNGTIDLVPGEGTTFNIQIQKTSADTTR